MKTPKKYPTAFSKDKQDSKKYSNKIKDLIQDTLPKNIHGMLASAVETNENIIFYNRWYLGATSKNNYYIYDSYLKEYIYQHIALFSTAVRLLWCLAKPYGRHVTNSKIIYMLDQEYFRCLEDIKFFKTKIGSKTSNPELFVNRLSQAKFRLDDIKTEISKIY